MRLTSQSHSHRSTTKVTHKPFKSRKATKGSLKEIQKGKVTNLSHRKNPHQQMMSKFDRRNQNRQKLQAKYKENLKSSSVFAGRDGAARIVAVIPLCSNSNATIAVQSLNNSIDIEMEIPEEGISLVNVDRFKQKIQYIAVKRDLIACLDATRIADFVLFVLSSDQEVDHIGETIIRSVESQGISTLITVVQGLDAIEHAKKKASVLTSLKSFISHFHPDQEKIHNIDSRQECSNLMRTLCTIVPKGIHWRDERSWMLVEDVQWPENPEQSVILTGTVRGKGLKADRLVQVGDWGRFQIEKITAAPLARKDKKSDDIANEDIDAENILEVPGEDQDDLAELAPEEVVMQDNFDLTMTNPISEKRGVLLDDNHYFSDDETHLPCPPKRLPKGTSAYQSAWFLGDEFSDSGSDYEDFDEQGDVEMHTPALPQVCAEESTEYEATEIAPTTYAKSEAFLDPKPDDESEAKQLAEFRSRKATEAEDDREFPDEIELHPQVLARERLARYRGLKSLRTSTWEESEDRAYEPQTWRRLFQVQNYKSARSRVTREALVGGVTAGKRVRVYLRDVPLSLKYSQTDSFRPLSSYSLLRHEHKRAVVNFSVTLNSDHPEPIKSKTELILQCGPRRFVIKPLFSQSGKTPNDVHKFDRFLHPGQTAVATFIAPVTWGSIPSLLLKRTTSLESAKPILELIGTCTSLPPSSNRVIAKRVILTGHPYKIHKKLVTIRYMFFNREDVEWFKSLQLWTKRGRSGYIKETLGTHGYYKATFDGKLNPQDTVGVSLYKRMWPRDSLAWNEAHDEVRDVNMELN
ncbi:Ribosome biogenesis protein tsr1 [Golovinomyces cichoracearum]|uniref:Ribosome biogenesis protein tsr1 n=1 Tax=Golovinomyces cichoracearum TaxID=62708 RepID=A0A420IJJ5_9PEZI|nr:Ribosome biogenesis protein tsr1 [Golovinomyces cichoracearum]